MTFIPKLHIFVGQHNHFFTLRESYMYEYHIRGRRYTETRYSHIRNLSQNWQEAVEKAKEASKELGIELHARESEVEQLKEIERVTKEEAEQRRIAAEQEHRLAQEQQDQINRVIWEQTKVEITDRLAGIIRNDQTEDQYVEMIRDCFVSSNKEFTAEDESKVRAIYKPYSQKVEYGRMYGGAFDNILLTNVPKKYMQWLVYKSGLCEVEDTYRNKMAIVAQWVCDNMDIAAPTVSEWVGNVGDKTEMELTVEDMREIDGYYGRTYLYQLSDNQGNQLVWFASKPALSGIKAGKFKFTIKAHNEFNGEKQTAITRAKVA